MKRTKQTDDLTMARRATAYAALTETERRGRVHMAAWQCVCVAEARRFVAAVGELRRYDGPGNEVRR